MEVTSEQHSVTYEEDQTQNEDNIQKNCELRSVAEVLVKSEPPEDAEATETCSEAVPGRFEFIHFETIKQENMHWICEYGDDNAGHSVPVQDGCATENGAPNPTHGGSSCCLEALEAKGAGDDGDPAGQIPVEPGIPTTIADHGPKSPNSGKILYRCRICYKGFCNWSGLVTHSKRHTSMKQFECTICHKQYTCLSTHMRTHMGDKPFECKICLRRFNHWSNLVQHSKKHASNEEKLKCKVCGEKFATVNAFTTHGKTHEEEKTPFKCEVCGKEYFQLARLVTHRAMHATAGKRPFKCGVCHRGFSSNLNLIQHGRTHTLEKPYECGVCDKQFGLPSNLIAHMKIHTGEQPFKCETCGKRFIRLNYLRMHAKTHSGFGFNQRKLLQLSDIQAGLPSEIKTHTWNQENGRPVKVYQKRSTSSSNPVPAAGMKTDKLFRCNVCKEEFPDQQRLDTHSLTHTDQDTSV